MSEPNASRMPMRKEPNKSLFLSKSLEIVSISNLEKMLQCLEGVSNSEFLKLKWECLSLNDLIKLTTSHIFQQCIEQQEELDLYHILQLTNYNVSLSFDIASKFKCFTKLTIPYDKQIQTLIFHLIRTRLTHSENLIRTLVIKAERQQNDVIFDGFIFYILSYFPSIPEQVVTENVQMVNEITQVDADFYHLPSGIRSLATQLLTRHQSSTLSTQFFQNLTYLYLQTTSDMNLFTLKHQHMRVIKLESLDGDKMCFDIDCVRLQRFICVNTGCRHIVLKNEHLNNLFNSVAYEISVFVFDPIKLMKIENYTVRTLKLTNIVSGATANIIFQISTKFLVLQVLELRNVLSEVTDEHVAKLIMNRPTLESLDISCACTVGKSDYYQDVGQLVCRNNDDQKPQLKHLRLVNTHNTDKLAQYLYLLDVNYQIQSVWLENLQYITNSTIFILLTSTDVRQSSYKRVSAVRPKSQPLRQQRTEPIPPMMSVPLPSMRYQHVSMQNEVESLHVALNLSLDFSCYVRDDIEDERGRYRLQKLSIINCSNINENISYAVQYASSALKFFQFDRPICPRNIAIMMQKRDLTVSIKGRRIGKHQKGVWWYSQPLSFDDIL